MHDLARRSATVIVVLVILLWLGSATDIDPIRALFYWATGAGNH